MPLERPYLIAAEELNVGEFYFAVTKRPTSPEFRDPAGRTVVRDDVRTTTRRADTFNALLRRESNSPRLIPAI